MTDITELLFRARDGDRASLDRVFHVLYPELKRIAAARVGALERTLSPTVLVNELYLRFEGKSLAMVDRRHFLACAARAMRGLAIDHARAAGADKRGGGLAPVTLTVEVAETASDVDLFALDQALDALGAIDEDLRELVELHWFAGIDFVDIAELRGVSERTVRRAWQRARALLAAQLSGGVAE